MRCDLLWLTASLVSATYCHILTVDHITIDVVEAPNIGTITTGTPPELTGTSKNDDKSLNSSTTTKSVFHRHLDSTDERSDSDHPSREQTHESSRSEDSQSNEQGSFENPPPKETTEIKSSESKSSEHTSESKPSEEDSVPQSAEKSESQEDVPDGSAESVSADISADVPSPGNPTSSETDSDDDDINERVEQTTHGPVKGHRWKETDIYAFIDIPYGKVEKPFEAPHTAQSWIDVHDVKEHNSVCPQYRNGYMGDLNCLTLSIFVPAEVENAGVFFYVHDSSFNSGDPMIYGPEHLVPKGVILVLPNYRLNALGFLCLQNETAPGNAGLKDLSKALEWTKENIEQFGGNSSNIVVGGDGDAGALAGYLALCSPSKYNIQKVITESGSMLSHLALDRNPEFTAEKLAKNIRVNHLGETIYDNTFAEASVQVIVEAAKSMRFNPCIEHNKEPFINASPWTLLQNNEIDITFMIGSASHAGTHEAVATTDSFIEQLNTDYGLLLPEDLLFRTSESRNEHALKIKLQYFGNDTISRSQMTQLSLLSTDASYLGPLIRSARPLVNAGATVFLYEFMFVGDFNRELIALDKPVEGAVRSDIIGYLFTQEGYVPDPENTLEVRIIKLMVDLWVSFINTGTPTAENIEWEKLKAGEDCEEEFLEISSEPRVVKGVHVDRLRLWTELYDEFFIERSFALSLTPGCYVFVTILFWITNTKLDY